MGLDKPWNFRINNWELGEALTLLRPWYIVAVDNKLL